MSGKIAIQLMGGIGNQLFQLFALFAFAIEQKIPPQIVFSHNLNERQTYWETFLYGFKPFTTYRSPPPKYDIDKIMSLPVWQEPSFLFTPIPTTNIPAQFRISGYFPCYRYFNKPETKSRIYEYLHLTEQQNDMKPTYYAYVDDDDISISMHFRLGDYKYKQEFHPVLPYEYYERALQTILKDFSSEDKIKILYFCEKEDNAYVNNIIARLKTNIQHNCVFSKVDDTIVDWKQLLLMSLCDNHIIANSSFSWFGAYFSGNMTGIKKICYPSLWFGPALPNHNTIDLFPAEWIKI